MDKKNIIATGFWEERQTIIDDMEEGEKPSDFCDLGFEFMEGDQSLIDGRNGLIVSLMAANNTIDSSAASQVIDLYSAYRFLHGDCNIFAQYLNERYGYKVEAVFEQDDENNTRLIHMYCVDEKDSKNPVYIDVRGKCNDWDLFMQDFYDNGLWANDDYTNIFTGYDSVPEEYLTSKEDAWRYDAARMIDEANNYYRPVAG